MVDWNGCTRWPAIYFWMSDEMRIFIIVGVVLLAGCSTAASDSKSSNIAAATTLIKHYMAALNCTKIDSSEFVEVIPQAEGENKNRLVEHWRMTGCGKTHEVQLLRSSRGNFVSIQALK